MLAGNLSAGLSGLVRTGESLAGALSAALLGLGESLGKDLSASLSGVLVQLGQLGASLATDFMSGFGAGVSALLKTGGSWAVALPGLNADLMVSINAALSVNLGAVLNGLGQTGEALSAGLRGALVGLVNTVEGVGAP
jgi:hypothetical protein